jgi:hypothetical protein
MEIIPMSWYQTLPCIYNVCEEVEDLKLFKLFNYISPRVEAR